MKLRQVKSILTQVSDLNFRLPDGTRVPSHFHVTEIGKVNKHFIDCGGTERQETVVNFQLWVAEDYDHRLQPEKLGTIIEMAEKSLDLPDAEIEVEYQGATIQKFGLQFNGKDFELTAQQTDCLAKDQCGIPAAKPKVALADLQKSPGCTPGGNCC